MPAVFVDEEQRLKPLFAAALLKHPQTMEGRFEAALTLTADTGLALRMAHKWFSDPDVLALQEQLTKGPTAATDGLDFIGSKADFCREVLEHARKSWDGEVKHKFYKLYADARGFVTKAETNVNVAVTNNRVMVVKDMGSDADWERKAAEQQRRLIDVSSSKH